MLLIQPYAAPGAAPRRGFPAWAAALVSGVVVFVAMAVVIAVLGANGEGSRQQDALEACQRLMVEQNRLLPGGNFSETEYMVAHNYADDSFNVRGAVSARPVVGNSRINIAYVCAGMFQDDNGDWTANYVDTANAF